MITADFTQAVAFMNKAISGLSNPTPFYQVAGNIGKEAVQYRIQVSKTDPDGKAWHPWSVLTEKHRTKKGNADQGLLWDRGDLLNSINMHVDANGVTVDTSSNHAIFLQLGTKNMMAREFMGWSSQDEEHINAAFIHWVDTNIL